MSVQVDTKIEIGSKWTVNNRSVVVKEISRGKVWYETPALAEMKCWAYLYEYKFRQCADPIQE